LKFQKVLIANRGAIACRVIRTLKRMGIGSVAVYSEADRNSLHTALADEAVLIGPPPAAQSYLSFERIFAAAHQTGAQAIHPGYGFLSENAEFAGACITEGLRFIGPTPAQMVAFGLKHSARRLAEEAGVPLLPGSGLLPNLAAAEEAANRIGYPVMVKATAGGGGIGMRLCSDIYELRDNFAAVERLGRTNFKDGGIYLERFVTEARHIEVQIFGDGSGTVIALGERDCSAQRRNQKVIEETPAPGISATVRDRLLDSAVRLAGKIGYESAGTVEFLYDSQREEFYFLEVNTRLQVEHGVTEEVCGIDLVEWMVLQASGDLPPLSTLQPTPAGHSIQVRIYAEQPHKNFQPSVGQLSLVKLPPDARNETGVETGSEVAPYYDPLLAKIIVKGEDRAEAVAKLQSALTATVFAGIETNLDYLRTVIDRPDFQQGGFPTRFLSTIEYLPRAFEILEPGTQTTVQDAAGRRGYWAVGVPPSGPMDALAFRLANQIVGNADNAAGLECTLIGPSLRFLQPAVIALTGADMQASLEGQPVARWTPLHINAGGTLRLSLVAGPGARAYLAIRGGIEVPDYLGSKSTFILGKFGGHAGRTLRTGDLLRFGSDEQLPAPKACHTPPTYETEWRIGVTSGPHGAPDFFTENDIQTLFSTRWKVHHNSDRTGIRLIGPKPEWARRDGGEAGLHPSNIHDNAYAVGALDFTGDMPIILGPDGPSLGGFVCPVTIVHDELWKTGQLKAGDRVHFHLINDDPAILRKSELTVVRASGDRHLLIEFGTNHLDFGMRLRAHALMQWFESNPIPGIIDLTPGIRSLQIHYDSSIVKRHTLLDALDQAGRELKHIADLSVPSRIVHLPLSWDDPATRLAIDRYMKSERPDAPWCPSNLEFIRRINGLDSIEDVHRIVFDASYLVLGLGDVYLGAPVATPVDPRHRLVTTKYNPARTWTPENAVGIGGAYLCVYGMEGPGGYQFVGRTIQMWNTHKVTKDFLPEHPWLLRFFDRIRFYPVSSEELEQLRHDFPQGKFTVKTEPGEFNLRGYQAFAASITPQAEAFKSRQQAAFDAERERWAAAGQAIYTGNSDDDDVAVQDGDELPPGCHPVRSSVTASVWNIAAQPGQLLRAGDKLIVLEAMKMEIVITAPITGRLLELRCTEGSLVMSGQLLAVMEPG
jgi:urea carboxylase